MDRLALWSPVPVMLGVGAYFSLEKEPLLWAAVLALAGCGVLLVLLWRTRLRLPVFIAFLVLAGFAAGSVRTHLIATPLITEPHDNALIEGTIDMIDLQEKGTRLVLSHPVIEGVAPEQTPVRVRIAFRSYDPAWSIGQRVRVRAMLYSLPQPSQPGGYDFARHLYFLSIGGTGFAFHPPEIVAQEGGLTLRQRIDALRHSIGDDMRAHMPGPAGDIAAAMTVGETGPIPEEEKSLLRDSGLSHMLAIAGLHLGLAAGIVFFTVRLLLSLWPRMAVRLPTKKIAAACALLAALVYLLMAGRPIPAQRSFIMVLFVLGGVLVDRRGISLRTLMLAALFILLVMPEAMYGASFQMSFSATLAIVAVYERFGRYLYRAHGGVWNHIRNHAVGIAATSIAATLSTAPFVLYNFDRFASFGVIANMMVIPLAALVIMPGVVLSLVLMPFGLQQLGYFLLEKGVEWMLAAAGWVTSLPGSTLLQPAPTPWGMALSGLGLMWLCLIRARICLLGLPIIAAGVATMLLHHVPDVFINGDGRQVMARTENGQYTMLKGQARAFAAQAWLRSEGLEEAVPTRETSAVCTRERCDFRNIIVLRKPQVDAVREAACAEHAAVLIAWWYLDKERCPGPALLIDRGELETHGAHTLRFTEQGIQVKQAWPHAKSQRPWDVPDVEESEEEATIK